MEKVKVVPDRIPNEINYLVVMLCIGSSIAFHYTMVFLGSTDDHERLVSYAVEAAFVISPLVSGTFAFMIARFYGMSRTFGRSYTILGFGYASSVVAELIYGIQKDVLEIDSYPSIADPFYAGLNVFLISHVVITLSYFAKTTESGDGKYRSYIEIRTLLLFISIFCIIVITYVVISLLHTNLQPNFEFFYGLLFVSLAGITLPFLVYAVMIFKNSAVGKAWRVLLLAFIVLVAGDVWYYYLEIFDQYTLSHPVNIFWFASYWIQTYALFKHKKAAS